MYNISNTEDLGELLSALNDQLAIRETRVELVVVGGSGLVALGQIDRATRDVDLVALRNADGLFNPEPLPVALQEAIAQVAIDFRLPEDWLNSGPRSLMDFGLPRRFEERTVEQAIGPHLTVHFASRFDQIHFKLYAMVDLGPGKHEQDLRAMEPTADELLTAARWTVANDPSEGYRMVLLQALEAMGVSDANSRI
jgi:hypothetical protein